MDFGESRNCSVLETMLNGFVYVDYYTLSDVYEWFGERKAWVVGKL